MFKSLSSCKVIGVLAAGSSVALHSEAASPSADELSRAGAGSVRCRLSISTRAELVHAVILDRWSPCFKHAPVHSYTTCSALQPMCRTDVKSGMGCTCLSMCTRAELVRDVTHGCLTACRRMTPERLDAVGHRDAASHGARCSCSQPSRMHAFTGEGLLRLCCCRIQCRQGARPARSTLTRALCLVCMAHPSIWAMHGPWGS